MGAPVMGGEVRGPAITGAPRAAIAVMFGSCMQRLFAGSALFWLLLHAGLPDKINWVEKFVAVGRPASEAAKAEHER